VPYLRSLDDRILSIVADMIEATDAEPRLVIDVPPRQRLQRKHDKIAAFVGTLVDKGIPLEAAVQDAECQFGVSRSTVMVAWSDYKKFMQGIERKGAMYLSTSRSGGT